jgi:hypothetical protein
MRSKAKTNFMKLILLSLIAASLLVAADAPKTAESATAPVLTAADRESLHEAQEALQADQLQLTLGQAAAARLPERQKAVDVAGKVLTDKCGTYGLSRDEAGRIQCGKVGTPPVAPAVKPVK